MIVSGCSGTARPEGSGGSREPNRDPRLWALLLPAQSFFRRAAAGGGVAVGEPTLNLMCIKGHNFCIYSRHWLEGDAAKNCPLCARAELDVLREWKATAGRMGAATINQLADTTRERDAALAKVERLREANRAATIQNLEMLDTFALASGLVIAIDLAQRPTFEQVKASIDAALAKVERLREAIDRHLTLCDPRKTAFEYKKLRAALEPADARELRDEKPK